MAIGEPIGFAAAPGTAAPCPASPGGIVASEGGTLPGIGADPIGAIIEPPGAPCPALPAIIIWFGSDAGADAAGVEALLVDDESLPPPQPVSVPAPLNARNPQTTGANRPADRRNDDALTRITMSTFQIRTTRTEEAAKRCLYRVREQCPIRVETPSSSRHMRCDLQPPESQTAGKH